MNRRSILVTLAVTLLSVTAWAAIGDARDADLRALAIGPAGMKINCKWSDLKAEERGEKIVLTSKLTNIKTGVGLRDNHLRKYFNTDRHPNATLTVDKSKIKLPEKGKTTRGSATGQLTLNGVTAPFTFTYKVKGNGGSYQAQALGDLDIRKHKVEVPCYLGVCVEPTVKLKVKFAVSDK